MPDAIGADGMVTWRELIAETGVEVGRPQARWLCEVASGLDGDELTDELDAPVSQRSMAHLDAMLARLRGGEPLQYVLGRWGFRRLDLLVDRRVLIPRPETELVAEAALALVAAIPSPAPGRLVCVDLGTGSGAIGLSLATELPIGTVEVWLTDASADALDVARANAAGAGRAAAAVRIAEGSWFDALPSSLRGGVHLVVSNPPYVPADDPAVESIVRDWEPGEALFAGADGLDAVRHIVAEAMSWLAPDGWLVLEIGTGQGPAVAALMRSAGFIDVEVRPDLSGHDRIAIGRQPKRAAT